MEGMFRCFDAQCVGVVAGVVSAASQDVSQGWCGSRAAATTAKKKARRALLLVRKLN